MKKVIEFIREKRISHYIFIIIIGLLISIPFLWVQIKNTDDGWLHLLRLIGIDNVIQNGNFPFLVSPFFCNNWGYSMTAFYPTIVSYIPYFIGVIIGTFSNGIKIFAALTTILSGIFMYNFVNEVTDKKKIALLSAIIYMTLPYKLEDLYNRFAIGEFTAFVFIPIVFQGLYNLLHGDKKRHFYIAIGGAGLLLTHTISTVYTALFCLIYILFNLKLFLKKDVIIKCIINVIFILLISAMFWVPMLEFESSTHYAIFEPDALKTSGKYVANNTIELWQLLKDKGEENGVSFVVGIPFIIMLLLGVFVYNKLDKKIKDFYLTSIVLGIISIIMCTKFFPWIIMPNFLCTVQYPWRLLGFALFFLTPLCGINIYYLINRINKKWIQDVIYMLVILIIMLFTVKELSVYTSEDTSLDQKYESSTIENPVIHYFSVNRDYMPLNAIDKQRTYLLTRTDNTYLLSGNVTVENETKNGLHLEISIKDAEQGSMLELPYLFYPGYNVVLQYDDNEIKLETSESENGFIKITIPENIEEGKIIAYYTGTTLEKIAYIVSEISIIIFVIYIIYFRKINKEEINEG